MKLNSTGSYSYSNGHYWSYDTKLTDTFKGYKIYNGTWYSSTTAKHQAKLRYEYSYDITLTQCSYGDWDAEQMIKNEIDYIKNQIKTLEPKRNTQKKLDTIAELTSKLELLESLVSEETEEKTDWFEEFRACWNELSDKNKEHVRKGLGDNLIQSEEQAKNVTATIKSMLLMQNVGLL